MDENRLARTARDLSGNVQAGTGHLTGNVKTQAEVAANQLAGAALEL